MQKKIRVVQTSMDDGSNIHPPPDSKLRRLRWTRQLHDQFIDAVTHLGGAEKATPKSVMLMMDVPGLTLYHLKSHLQKYRLVQSREQRPLPDYRKQVANYIKPAEISSLDLRLQLNESMTKMQTEIEVQKHLQLRIEAQAKYLQTVLKKAEESLTAGTDSTLIDSCLTSLERKGEENDNDVDEVEEDNLCKLEIGASCSSIDQSPHPLFIETQLGKHKFEYDLDLDLNK